MNQYEKNMVIFNDLLKTSLRDVDSFKKEEVSAYFLVLRKFFKNYIKENNKNHSYDSPLFIRSEEAKSLYKFFDAMIEIFAATKSTAYVGDMKVVGKAQIKKLTDFQSIYPNQLLLMQKEIAEILITHKHEVDNLIDDMS
jgi:hypothetical protein